MLTHDKIIEIFCIAFVKNFPKKSKNIRLPLKMVKNTGIVPAKCPIVKL